jgi:predicted transposase YbfD/YdcC
LAFGKTYMTPVDLRAFFTCFEDLEDPRLDRRKLHNLFDVVVIAVCAAASGANSWLDVARYGRAKFDFLSQFLELPNGIPSHDTFSRVFALLDCETLLQAVMAWLQELATKSKGRLIAIDGKTLRGSFDTATGLRALHLVSAWADENRLVLGQVAVDDKSNEITAIPQLLRMLDLEGAMVTIDAMGCQTAIAEAIRAQGADYLLTAKDNQPTLHQEIADHFIAITEGNQPARAVRRQVVVEKSHGRIESREYVVAPAPSAMKAAGKWKDIQTIGMVVSITKVGDKETGEVRHFISSAPPKVKTFAQAVRSHWHIESKLHWSLDVTFNEDKSRIRKGNGPANAAILRRLAMSILQQDTSIRDNIRGKRMLAGWNDEFLLKILSAFKSDI